jgi:hypothetical protein
MKYNVNVFTINTARKTEELEEKEIRATKIFNLRPQYEEVNKKRIYLSLESFCIGDTVLTNQLLEVIAFTTVLQSYSGNKLDSCDYHFETFTAGLTRNNGKMALFVKFNNYEKTLYFDKLICNVIASQLNRVMAKLELD